MRRYLVIANQTLVSHELIEVIRDRMRRTECEFHVVVPATVVPGPWTWTEGKAAAMARERLDEGVKLLGDLGAIVTGAVGDPNPMAAIADSLMNDHFDGIILSTFPPGRSEWLKMNLPARAARRFGLPVHHVVAQRMPVA